MGCGTSKNVRPKDEEVGAKRRAESPDAADKPVLKTRKSGQEDTASRSSDTDAPATAPKGADLSGTPTRSNDSGITRVEAFETPAQSPAPGKNSSAKSNDVGETSSENESESGCSKDSLNVSRDNDGAGGNDASVLVEDLDTTTLDARQQQQPNRGKNVPSKLGRLPPVTGASSSSLPSLSSPSPLLMSASSPLGPNSSLAPSQSPLGRVQARGSGGSLAALSPIGESGKGRKVSALPPIGGAAPARPIIADSMMKQGRKTAKGFAAGDGPRDRSGDENSDGNGGVRDGGKGGANEVAAAAGPVTEIGLGGGRVAMFEE